MVAKVPREFILELIQRIDIVDLIDARVPLKQVGANYSARCPFHNEKTPSFSVNRSKQFYHCFGCGAHGNAITFLMEFERLSFLEAVALLANELGLPILQNDGSAVEANDASSLIRFYEIQAQVARFYARQFKLHPEGKRAVDYLRCRGISGEIAKEYLVGFAPPDWRNLPNSWTDEELETCGLIVRKAEATYDRFRNRIIFPIRERRGRVVGFGGRAIANETPKYLNSPDTATFKKHKEVYGLHELLTVLKRPARILVVEGYMDVIALAQNGIRYAVATLGTATSADHISLLFRYVDELVFCFDGDPAGQSAAWKALGVTLPLLRDGKLARFLILPAKHDPDSLVRSEGSERFEQRIAESLACSEFLFRTLQEGRNLTDVEDRAAFVNHAKSLLELVPKGTFRSMMYQRLYELTGQRSPRPRNSSKLTSCSSAPLTPQSRPSAFRTLIALVVQQPDLVGRLDEEMRKQLIHSREVNGLANELLALLIAKPDMTPGEIIEHFRGTEFQQEVEFLTAFAAAIPENGIEREFLDALEQFRKRLCDQRIEQLLRVAKSENLSSTEREELLELLKRTRRPNSTE